MTLQQLDTKGHVFLDDLRDVVFSASPIDGATLKITAYSSVILNHRYYGDADSEVHLDLRDLVRNRTSFALPDGNVSQTPQEDSGIYLTVEIDDTEEYGFYCFGYADGLRQRLSNIDFLRIPEDFRMILSFPNLANILGERTVTASVKFIDHVRTRQLEDLPIGDSDGYILVKEYSMADVQPALHMPFQLEFSFPGIALAVQPRLTTPVYEVCPGSFEQYLFLTETGALENIPMDGDLKTIPEYSFENARHPSGMVKVKDGLEELWEQSSGFLTETAAEELHRLLCSSDIYHLEDGSWKRILIEIPTVTLSKKDTLRSLTFTWRHVETD